MMNKKINALLVNPYIHDFKLYDEWMKPLGLYYVADYLVKNGFNLYYINTMTREHPQLKNLKDQREKSFFTGDFHSEVIGKPSIYNYFPRKYKRYGIPLWFFLKELNSLPKIDVVLITSYMTYWYSGVVETIRIIKQLHPGTPVVLGGLYATLCFEHANKHSGADLVIKGHLDEIKLKYIFNKLNIKQDIVNVDNPYPRYEIEHHPHFLPLLTELGCPYNCTYCANKFINGSFSIINTEKVINTIDYYYHKKGIIDFTFYDDALLYKFEDNLGRILDHIINHNMICRFHTPNAIHARFITPYIAKILNRSGFKTIRLGFESCDISTQEQTGNKASMEEMKECIKNLKCAGFKKHQIGVYVMIGLKRQSIKEIKDSIDFIASLGVLVKPVTYSPIPNTIEYQHYEKEFPEIREEPLYHNDSFFLVYSGFMSYAELEDIKRYVRKLNSINE